MDIRSLCNDMPTTLEMCSRPRSVASAASRAAVTRLCADCTISCMSSLSFFRRLSVASMSSRTSRRAASTCLPVVSTSSCNTATVSRVSFTKSSISACNLCKVFTSLSKLPRTSLTRFAVNAAIWFAAALASRFASTATNPILSFSSPEAVCKSFSSTSMTSFFRSMPWTRASRQASWVSFVSASPISRFALNICRSSRRKLGGPSIWGSSEPQMSSCSDLYRPSMSFSERPMRASSAST
mmetsp:Transcript_6072/g.15565  ORF Transcript_6072/g.15565 Transcript_6072/m.15565 type:complete len:240 (+) Transcript_6072:564-1283(+)